MTQNTLTPIPYPLKYIMNWWSGKSIAEAKTGQFNLKLYMDYLDAQDQPDINVKKVEDDNEPTE